MPMGVKINMAPSFQGIAFDSVDTTLDNCINLLDNQIAKDMQRIKDYDAMQS